MVIVVKKCSSECPFCNTLESGQMQCNVSMPSKRPIPEMEEKYPSFCPLKREQVITRAFEE